MTRSLFIEQYLMRKEVATVRDVARQFRLSKEECLEELAALAPYGVQVDRENFIRLLSDGE